MVLMEAVFSHRKRGHALLKQPNVKVGDVVVVRYYDTVVFRDLLQSVEVAPVVREAIGWLDFENGNYIRLIWERHAEAIINEESKTRITGLAIRKSDIIEMRRIA
jgi:signal peptidase I